MSIWDDAAAAIAAVFEDPQPILYTQDGVVLPPITAVRSERADGDSQRTIVWEVPRAALPARATKRDSFTHAGRHWRIENVTLLGDVDAWELIVCDDGAAT